MHAPLITPFQNDTKVNDLDFDLEAKNSCLDFVVAWGIVFHKHTLIFYNGDYILLIHMLAQKSLYTYMYVNVTLQNMKYM